MDHDDNGNTDIPSCFGLQETAQLSRGNLSAFTTKSLIINYAIRWNGTWAFIEMHAALTNICILKWPFRFYLVISIHSKLENRKMKSVVCVYAFSCYRRKVGDEWDGLSRD